MFPGLPAHEAGLVGDDVIVAIDGQPVPAIDTLRARLSAMVEGATVRLRVRAATGGEREVALVAAPRPLEDHPGCEVVYGEVAWQSARLRLLSLLPPGPPRGWVLFVQGHGGAPVDCGGNTQKPLAALARAFAEVGFAFVRVERSGTGDSEGPPPEQLSLADELAQFAQAFAAARAMPWAEGRPGFLFGHSLGTLVAGELAAAKATRPRGLVVYGGGARTWTEYFDAACRRQWEMIGASPVEQERVMRTLQKFHALLLIEGLPLPEVLGRLPEVAARPALYGVESKLVIRGRPYGYWQEVYRAPVAERLAEAAVPTLAAWGTSDWLSDRDDHRLVAACANEGGPGLGTFVEIEGADHFFAERPTQTDSFMARDVGSLCPRLPPVLLDWMARVG